MGGPLEGIRVINWSQFTPSSTGYMLGDLGARVFKIEHPVQGDAYRGMGTMYGDAMSMPGGRHAGFEAVNRSQRSVTLDLKQDRGREILYKLIEKTDVFYTNYTQAVRERLKVDYETLSKINPRLVYAVSSAYGPEGPWQEKRGFDQTAQARSGLMFAMGDRQYDEPFQTVGGICDQMGATMLALGILAALVNRDMTGKGQQVDSSLLGASLHLQSIGLGVTAFRGKSWVRHSRTGTKNPLVNHYRCKDNKWILFSELQADRFWPQFCEALEIQHIQDDPRFATAMGGRREHARELIDILDETMLKRTRAEWVQRFQELDVPFAYSPVNDYYDVLEDEQVLANDYVVDFEHPAAGKVQVMGYPLRFSNTPAGIISESPEFGQHTEEVLMEELDLSWEDIGELRSQGLI